MRQIIEAIEAVVKKNIKTQVVVGEVISVDESNMTCDVDLQTMPDMLDVRLRAVIDASEKGILVVPKKGSHVLVGLIDNRKESAFVCGYSEVDKVRILCDEIELAGSGLGGLIKIKELKKQLDKNNAILTAILNVLTGGQIVEAGNGAPSALQIALKAVLTGKTVGDFSQIESEKVKHG